MTTATNSVSIEDATKQIEADAGGSNATANVVAGIKVYVDPVQLAKDVAFSVNDLDSAVMNQAGLFVHYASQKVAAMRQFERLKAALEILESQLDNLYREEMKKENPKTTEAAIAAAVKSDKRWWRAHTLMTDAKAVFELAKNACDAFDHRKDMIVQISVDRRTERQGQLRIGVGPVSPDVMAAASAAAAAANSMTGKKAA